MKTYLCDFKTDFSKVKVGNTDKVIVLYEATKGSEPLIPLSMFNTLNEIKGNIEFKAVETNMATYAAVLILGYEAALNNEVQILMPLNLDPKLLENLLSTLNLTNIKKKRTSRTQKVEESPVKEESPEDTNFKDDFPLPKPEYEEEPVKTKSKPVKKREETDDIDRFMDLLSGIDAELINHTKHIVDAAKLAKSENIIFAVALCRVAGEKNGNKIAKLLSGKASEIFAKALEIED